MTEAGSRSSKVITTSEGYIPARLSHGARMRPLSLALILALAPAALPAQQSPAQPGLPLEVGAVAPDFSLRGATRYGVLAKPVRLSDFKGKTVVLAFFFKARTSG
jgi:hypothetical protein